MEGKMSPHLAKLHGYSNMSDNQGLVLKTEGRKQNKTKGYFKHLGNNLGSEDPLECSIFFHPCWGWQLVWF